MTLALIATVLASGLGGQVDVQAAAPPNHKVSYVARIVMQSTARAEPSSTSKSVGVVRALAPWNKGPMQLLIDDVKTDAAGEYWIRVLLARKPNGSYGWIPADNARIFRNSWRITVDLSRRSMTIFKAGKAVKSTSTVIGARGTPTPTGEFAIREVVKQPEPGAFSGPWIFHLNANSEKLKSFDGGDGIIGIHGRGKASFGDPLGSARSHGCVRAPNRVVTYMSKHIVAGTPVLVRR